MFGLSSQVAKAGGCSVTLTSHYKHTDLALPDPLPSAPPGKGGAPPGRGMAGGRALVCLQNARRHRGSETLNDIRALSSCVTKGGLQVRAAHQHSTDEGKEL